MRGRENQSFHLRTETLIIVVRDANDYFKKGLGAECLAVVCMWLVPPRSTDVCSQFYESLQGGLRQAVVIAVP